MAAVAHFPFAPLSRQVRLWLGPRQVQQGGTTGDRIFDVDELGPTFIADYLDVGQHVILRWETKGLTERECDEIATSLGIDPYQLWPELLTCDDDGVPAGSFVCEGCDEMFTPAGRGRAQRFCCRHCRDNTRHRLKRVAQAAARLDAA